MKKNFASKKPIETFLDILQVYGTKIGGYMIFFSQGTIDWVDKFSFFLITIASNIIAKSKYHFLFGHFDV